MSSATSTSTSTSTPQYSMEIDPSRPAELQSESWNKMSSLYVNTAHHATNIYAQLGLDLCGIKEEVKQHPDKKDWKLLDVAAGTGAMTFDAAEFIHGKGTVTAIDFSPGMLQQIENRKATNPDKYGHITTAVMDGQALTLQDNTFDVAFSLFGLVFFPDTEKGLKEIYRVLKPGGTAVVMSYDTIETHDISSSIDEAQKMCGWKGGRPSGLYSLGDPTKFSNQLQAAGFKDYAIHTREHWWPFESYAPVITIAETGPPWADWYGSLTADERQKFRDALTTVLTRRWPSGKVRARSVTRIGVAKKTD